ncbi:MAG TPA: response regulator [Myxococcaceae bacterium]|nr:response regulator [Myxococcaceae bacterium]
MASAEPTILIVDDDLFVRTAVRDSLADDGYHMVEAADGDAALAELEKVRADLVILDLLMPNRSGVETLAEIRRLYPSLKVLIVSSLDTESMVEDLKRQGANHFIAKPFHPLEMSMAVRQLMGA